MNDLSEFEIVELKTGVGVSIGDRRVEFDPEVAEYAAGLMLRYAYHVRTGRDIDGRSVMSSQIREKTEKRMALVLVNLLERKKKPTVIVKELLEIVMREVS